MPQVYKLAKLSFVVVLFGQFGFSAAAYYLHVSNPSWPFWIILYATSGVLALGHITMAKLTTVKLTTPDLYFFAFIGYVVASFVSVGESNQLEFVLRLLLICIGPYLCGRIIGKYAPIFPLSTLQVLSLLYLLIIGVELVRNPDLFGSDRLFLFAAKDWDGIGGNPTSFNIGITLGSAWAIAFAYLSLGKERHSVPVVSYARAWLPVILLSFPAILLFIGSRTSVVSIALCAVVILGCASWVSPRKKIGWLGAIIAGLIVFYNFLPDQRKLLIDEIASAAFGFDDYASKFTFCAPGGSVFERVVQLSEAWRLFLESPLLGIGATNYGLRFCGEAIEFASPHSLLVHVLVEYGLIGASLLMLMLISIYRALLRSMRYGDYRTHPVVWGLFGVWVFVLIQVQFIGNLLYDYHVFLLTGLFVSSLYHGDRWVIRSNWTRQQVVT